MAEEPPAEGARHRPALDFQAGYGAFHISIKIDNPWLAAGLGAGIITLGAFYISNRESVEAAVKIALADLPGRILNITPSSILVKFVCDTEEKFLAFMKAFATGTLKQRLQKEFSKIGFKYKLEVTITVYDPESEMRTEKEEITSTFGRPVIVGDSSGVESMKLEDKPRRQLGLRKLKKLQLFGSRPAYPESRKEKEKTTTPSESGYSGVESIESESISSLESSPTPRLKLSSELKKLQPFGSRPAYPKSSEELMKVAVGAPSVKVGKPTEDELYRLGFAMEDIWRKLGHCLGVSEAVLDDIDQDFAMASKKGYHMLIHWKRGATASYEVLNDALRHEDVQRQDLAKKFCQG